MTVPTSVVAALNKAVAIASYNGELECPEAARAAWWAKLVASSDRAFFVH